MNKNLSQRWRTFRKNNIKTVGSSLEYAYEEKRKALIIEALTFWLFVRKCVLRYDAFSLTERLSFLKKCIDDKNDYITVIAKLESLPNEVIKKLVWRENIDFAGFEPMLRRIENYQVDAISTAYEEFVGDKAAELSVPTVYRKSLRDRLAFFLGKKSKASIMDGSYSTHDRWMTRSAWAFNLLDLDFGFSLYPNGHMDDTRIANKKFTRFISIKQHINDFVVNQFDGKYWWLYTHARSNYVWFPNRKVALQNHICPGFWWTLFVHLYFWIISPILFAGSIIALHHYGPGRYVFALLLTLFPTPITIVIAAVKAFCMWLADHSDTIGDFFEAIGAWITRHKKFLKGVWKGCIAAFHFLGTLGCVIWIWQLLTSLHVSGGEKVLVGAVIIFHGGFLIGTKFNKKWKEYDDINPVIRYVSLFIILSLLMDLYNRYLDPYVVKFCLYLYSVLTSITVETPFALLGIILAIVSLACSCRFILIAINDEKSFAKRTMQIRYISIGVLTVSALCLYYAQIVETVFETKSLVACLSLCVASLTVSMVFFLTIPINYETIHEREISRDFTDALYWKFENDYLRGLRDSKKEGILKSLSFRLFIKNKWLMGLGEPAQTALKDDILELFKRIQFKECDDFDKALFVAGFLRNTLPSLKEHQFSQLQEIEFFLAQRQSLHAYEVRHLIKMVFAGNSMEDSFRVVQKMRWKKQARQAAHRKMLVKIGSFFRLVFLPLTWSWKKVSQFFLTLKDLWSLFNEHCPYVNKSESIH